MSTLSGGNHWQIEVPGLTLMRPALTDFGLGLASGQNVIMVDRATGDIRWTYTRSDEPGRVSVASTGGGRQVLAWWGSGHVYVLDARTGERVGHWSTEETGSRLLDPALPVVARTGSDDRTTIARVSADGRDVWTYPVGRCAGARATLAESAVVVTVLPHCAGTSGRLLALDPRTGGELWSSGTAGDVRAVVPGTAVTVEPPGGARATGSLSAIDLVDGRRAGPASSRDIREWDALRGSAGAWRGAQVAVVVCTWDVTDYPMGPEEYSSTIYSYDVASGSTWCERHLRSAPVVSTAVTLDQRRVIVARADLERGLAARRGRCPDVAAEPECCPLPAPTPTVRGLAVFGDQVLVVDAAAETLRSLR